MKVTAIKRFKGHAPGETFDIPTGQARVLVKAKIVRAAVDEPEVAPPPQYQTRMLTAEVRATEPQAIASAPAKRTYTRRTPPASKE